MRRMVRQSRNPGGSPRRAAVAVQVLVCSVVILGMGALTIDVGKLYVARSELQRAADSAALAGASVYVENAGLIQDPNLAQIACERAQQFSLENWTQGAPTGLDGADVIAGALDLTDPHGDLDTSGLQRFNAVQVLVRRTAGSANGSVAYSFARIFGYTDGGVVAGATAALDDRFSGYTQTEQYGLLVPFTINKDTFAQMLASGPDDFSYDHPNDQVLPNPDGVREVDLYPYRQNADGGGNQGAGNFGLLNIGTGNQGDAVIEMQIREGVPPADLELEIGTSEIDFVDDYGQPETYNITGSPGLKTTLEDAVETRTGQIIGFFLHDLVTMSGQNAVYRIVGLRFGRVMHIDLHGNPNDKRLVIQPVAYTGPGVIVSEDAPSSDGQVGRLRLVR
jgi:hypothetical protein